MDDKIGVFICTGYGIGEALDIDALSEVATGEYSVPFCKTVESCEGPGLEEINQDIQSEGCILLAELNLAATVGCCYAL